MDSLLSIVQMPKGIPVATVAIGNGTNAGLLAIQMLSMNDKIIEKGLDTFRLKQFTSVRKANKKLK